MAHSLTSYRANRIIYLRMAGGNVPHTDALDGGNTPPLTPEA